MKRKKEYNCEWSDKKKCYETAPVPKTTAKAKGGSKPTPPVKNGGSLKPPVPGTKPQQPDVKAAMDECKKNAVCRAVLECKAQHHKDEGGKGSGSGAGKPQVSGLSSAAAVLACGKNALCKAVMQCHFAQHTG